MFSAAYKEDSRMSRLWAIKNIRLVTSLYAMEEAERNQAYQHIFSLRRGVLVQPNACIPQQAVLRHARL